MSAGFYAFLLFWFLQNNAVGAELPPPDNLTMITLNTNYTLSWDWDQRSADRPAVNFITQYVAKFKLKSKKKSPIWDTACKETSRRSCDLTHLKLYFLGIYVLRVQAIVNGRHSDWALKEFCPDKDAALGPPTKVKLSPAGSNLDVFISDPLTSTNSSMKEKHPELYYHILYWERSEDRQVSRTQTLDTSVNVTLPDLKAWTWYCVSIQTRYDFFKKNSTFTSPQCMQTEGPTPWWQIVLYFLASLLICFLVMLPSLSGTVYCYRKLKATFYPSVQLPTPFQYLSDSSGSDIPRLLSPDSDSELLCDKVTVCPEPLILEIHHPPPEALLPPPSDLDPDSSGRHSRQDSSGSGDSGVYSSGGSGLQQPSCQSSTGTEDSTRTVQDPFDLDQVKMQDMAPGLKTQLLITDEGIVDMCV